MRNEGKGQVGIRGVLEGRGKDGEGRRGALLSLAPRQSATQELTSSGVEDSHLCVEDSHLCHNLAFRMDAGTRAAMVSGHCS